MRRWGAEIVRLQKTENHIMFKRQDRKKKMKLEVKVYKKFTCNLFNNDIY